MEPRAQAARPLLRRLGVALKIFALYPPPSPPSRQVVAELVDALHSFGPLTVRVSKRSLQVGAATFKDLAAGSLAFHLYTRRIIGFTFMPGITAYDINTFLTVVRRERAALEAEGGVAHLLQREGIHAIRVAELFLGIDQSPRDPSWDAVEGLIAQGTVSPDQREIIADTLRAGPKAIAALFERLRVLMGDGDAAGFLERPVQDAYRLIKSLDRLIVNEPVEDHEHLYADLTAAVMMLDEPLRTPLRETLAAQAGEDETARLLLSRLSGQRLAGLVPTSTLQAAPAASGSATSRTIEDQQETFLDPEFQPLLESQAGWSAPAGYEWYADGDNVARDVVTVPPALDDASVTREAVSTLIDLLRSQDDGSDITEIARTLETSLPSLVHQLGFRLLRAALQGLQNAVPTSAAHRQAVTGIFITLVQPGPLGTMLESLWNSQGPETEADVRACMEILAGEIVAPLMRLLGEEPRADVRRRLCDLIVAIGRGHVDEVGAFVSDARWYLARNAASILGRLEDPKGIVHLAAVRAHPEYRVRREVVEALVRIGSDEAEAHIATFLDDVDERIAIKAVLSLNDGGVHLALPRLLGILEQRDPWHPRFVIKQAVLSALIRARVVDAMPVLQRLARARFVVGRRSRVLRRQARQAVAALAAEGSDRERLAVNLTMETGAS
jgi:hypothetical protein